MGGQGDMVLFIAGSDMAQVGTYGLSSSDRNRLKVRREKGEKTILYILKVN